MCRLLDWSLGTASITDAGGVMDISRWCEPPVPITKCVDPRQGRRNGRRAISAAPAGARIQSSRRTRRGGLMSNVPSGQVVAFPALILDMQCVLGGPRPPLQKTSLPSSPGERRYPASKIADIFQQIRSEISEGNPGGCQNEHDAEE